MSEVEIVHGLSELHRSKAGELYYKAFRQKLHPIFRDEQRGLEVLQRSLRGTHAIVALLEGELVGIAGFKDDEGSLLDIQLQSMVDIFGFLGGWTRLLGLSIFERGKQPGILLMDGIVVDADARGMGIGTKLLDAVVAYAQAHQYAQVRLDVVDTNPRARHLYERKGFVATETQHYPFFNKLFGFSGATTMTRDLKPGL